MKMLKQQLSPQNAAIALGSLLMLCVLLGVTWRWRQGQTMQDQETKMAWQRDREMGVSNTGQNENASPEEKEAARTSQLEKQLTQERTGGGITNR